jgi:peptide/nickel transport system permease protein
MIPTLIGVTLLVFLIMAMAPGGLGAGLRDEAGSMRPEQRKVIEDYYKKRYGLDQPLWRQYLRWANQVSPVGLKDAGVGFPASWRVGVKVPDLGESFLRKRPVIDVVADTLPITLLLNLITIPIIYVISILSGIYAAKYRGKTFDVASGTAFLALWSLPTMWVGVMLLGLLANRDNLQWFPTAGLHDTQAGLMSFLPSWGGESGFERGWLLDTLWHLALPVLCLTYGGFAFMSKLMRASVLENLQSDYARTARAKGLADRVVLMRHVLSNSLLPLITVAAGILPGLLGGSLIVETIFSINGMGRLMIEAIQMKDRELVMSQTYVIGAISLLCVIVSDVCYAIADPRVSYE